MTTAQALETLPDAGQFEILGTRVLRELEEDCKAIAHIGVNTEGKTIKNPVDGFCVVPGSDPPRYVMEQFTIAPRKKLQRKWLFDHTVSPNAMRATGVDDGDLIKCGRKAEPIRDNHPTAEFIVYLCTNRFLNTELMQQVYDKAASIGLEARFLEQSRLRDFLDTKPEGQWLRQEHLGIQADQVSRPLLQKLSRLNLDRYAADLFLASVDQIVATRAAAAAADAIKTSGSLHLLIGPSGVGKSVIGHGLLQSHIAAGGIGFWIPSEIVERAVSLPDAVGELLRSVHPWAGTTAGHDTLALATADAPLMVIVDDVNRTGEPARLLQKVTSWSRPAGHPDGQASTSKPSVRMVCPVWDSYWLSLRHTYEQMSWIRVQAIGPMHRPEAVACIRGAMCDQATRFSHAELEGFAERLHNDPILLALFGHLLRNDPGTNPLALSADVIGRLVEKSVGELAVARGCTPTDYLIDLMRVSKEMIRRKVLYPPWRDVQTWFPTELRVQDELAQLVAQGHVCRLTDRDGVKHFEFRHDRILEHHLAIAAAEMLKEQADDRFEVTDPYFVPYLGRAIALSVLPRSVLDWVRETMPHIFVAAIPYLPTASSPYSDEVVATARDWLTQAQTAPESVYLDAFRTLSATHSPHVLEVTDGVPEHIWLLEARLRNGDAVAGAKALSHRFYPSRQHAWLESLIDQARTHHAVELLAGLDSILTADRADDGLRNGALCLAGYLGISDLAGAITFAWDNATNHGQILLPTLWAALRCAGEHPDNVIGPMIPAILAVPDDESRGFDEREALLLSLQHAVRHGLNEHVLAYLADLGQSNEAYDWIVAAILDDIDHPIAIRYVVPLLADAQRSAKQGGGISPWAVTWGNRRPRRNDDQQWNLSAPSVDALRALWNDESNPEWVRDYAFSHWARNVTDLAELRSIATTSRHFQTAVWTRAQRGDKDVAPHILAKVADDRRWFEVVPEIWTRQFEPAVDAALTELGTDPRFQSSPWLDAHYLRCHMLRDIPTEAAEQFLVKHWPSLGTVPLFIQAALYHGTEKCRTLAAESIGLVEAEQDPFGHISSFFGFFTHGLMDRLTIRHLETLRPYLDRIGDFCISDMIEFCHRFDHWDWALRNLQPVCRKRNQAITSDPDGDSPYIVRITKHWFASDQELLSDLDVLEREDPCTCSARLWEWWQRFVERGDSGRRASRLLEQWLETSPSLARFTIVALAFRDHGNRQDLAVLQNCKIDPRPDEFENTLADVEFAVMRRSLD